MEMSPEGNSQANIGVNFAVNFDGNDYVEGNVEGNVEGKQLCDGPCDPADGSGAVPLDSALRRSGAIRAPCDSAVSGIAGCA